MLSAAPPRIWRGSQAPTVRSPAAGSVALPAVTGFGVFSADGSPPRVGWCDGGEAVDLTALGDVFAQHSLNELLALGRGGWADALAAARAHDGPRVPLAEAA